MAKKKRTKKSELVVPQDQGEVVHVSKAPCSLEFSRNAKGVATWGIKLYGERTEMDQIVDQVLALDERLREEERSDPKA